MKTKVEAIEQITELIGQVTARFTEEDADEQAWMRDQCSPEAQRILAGLSVQALHLLDALPPQDDTGASMNIVGLAQATGIPKGTVSKAVQRLVAAGVVTRHQLRHNRKEVHLRLTDLGAEIQNAHRSLHEQVGSDLTLFLTRYTIDDLDTLKHVLSDLLRMPRQGLRFRPDLLD